MLSVLELQNPCGHSPCPTLRFGVALPLPVMLLPPLWEVKWLLAWAMSTGLGMPFPLLSTGHRWGEHEAVNPGKILCFGKKCGSLKREQGLSKSFWYWDCATVHVWRLPGTGLRPSVISDKLLGSKLSARGRRVFSIHRSLSSSLKDLIFP